MPLSGLCPKPERRRRKKGKKKGAEGGVGEVGGVCEDGHVAVLIILSFL